MSLHRRRSAAMHASRVDTAPLEYCQHGQDYSGPIAPRMPTPAASGIQEALRKAQRIGDARAAALAEQRVRIAPPERWQHGSDCAPAIGPRMPTSVASGVQALRRAKCIDDAEVTASERFRRDYTWGIEGVHDPLEGRCGAHDLHNTQIARAEAVTHYRQIADVIGPRLTAMLVALVVMDFSFVAMAAEFMPGKSGNRIDMRGCCMALLMLLARMYATVDRSAGHGRGRSERTIAQTPAGLFFTYSA